MNKKYEKVLKAHMQNCNYNITPPRPDSKDHRWKVWVKFEGEERKKIAKNTENELMDAMYDYYFAKERQLNSLEALFPIWLEERKEQGLDIDTIRKDQNHFDKFYKNHPIMSIHIKKLTAFDVTNFINSTIIKFELTTKATHNMKLIMKGLCSMANLMGLNDSILFIPDTFNLKRCSISRARLETKIERAIPSDSKKKLIEYLENEFLRKPLYSPTLAILISLQTGLRNGELSSIELNMINLADKVIYVRKAENSSTKKATKKLKTKSGYRTIPLNKKALKYVTQALKLANQLPNPYGYLFVDSKGNRKSSRSIAAKLQRTCKELNMIEYSPHDIRRTVATEIYTNSSYGIDAVQALLGHSTKSQSYDYIHDIVTHEMVAAAVDMI